MTASIQFTQFAPPVWHDTMTSSDTLAPEAEFLAAESLARVALNPGGQPFADEDADTWADADETEPEVVSLGPVRFKIVGDGAALAKDLGALDPSRPDAAAFIVELHPEAEDDALTMGNYILLKAEADVAIPFMVWVSRDDLNAPVPEGFDLGPQAERNTDLDVLGARQALVVQVFEE